MCFEGRNCETFTQIWEPWTSCIPLGGQTCGAGFRYQNSNCFFGPKIVHPNKCAQIDKPNKVEVCSGKLIFLIILINAHDLYQTKNKGVS